METQAATAASPLFALLSLVSILAAVGFIVATCWKVFQKAGQPGWACLVPIYNLVVMLKIAQRPAWYFILFFVPVANLYALFSLYNGIAKSFGKSTGFTIGLVVFSPIFMAILAFGDSVYIPADKDVGTKTLEIQKKSA